MGVVVDDPAVDDPLDVGHGRPHDLAGECGVHILGPKDPPGEGDRDVGLAGKLRGTDVVPLLLVEPRGLVARRGTVVEPLVDDVVPEVLEPAILIGEIRIIARVRTPESRLTSIFSEKACIL